MTENFTKLYLLVFPSKRLIKIGKADNVYTRYRKLRRWWGKADLAESYELTCTKETVLKLEKALHLILSAYTAEATVGDGWTEMFDLAGLEPAVVLLNALVTSGAAKGSLTKGVAVPVPPELTVKAVHSPVSKEDLRVLELLVHHSETYTKVRVSRAELGRALNRSEASIKRAVAALKTQQYLTVEKAGGTGGANVYTVTALSSNVISVLHPTM